MDVLSKSVSELGGWKWKGAIPTIEDSSYEEFQYYNLHTKPIKDYSLEDLYFMIGQGTCLEILVPLAINSLSQDLFVQSDDYPGDLLQRLLTLPDKFWKKHPDENIRIINLLKKFEDEIERLNDSWEIRKMLRKLVKEFVEHS